LKENIGIVAIVTFKKKMSFFPRMSVNQIKTSGFEKAKIVKATIKERYDKTDKKIKISSLATGLILIASLSFVSTRKACSCDFKLINKNHRYMVQIPDNVCDYKVSKNLMIKDSTMEFKNNIMPIMCGDELMVLEKPNLYNRCKYLDEYSCSIYNYFTNLIFHIVSYLFFHVFKNQVISLAILVYSFLMMLIGRYLRSCDKCKTSYLLKHDCVPMRRYNIKNIYIIIIFILHFLSFKVNGSLEHSVISTDSGSLVTIPNNAGLINVFSVDDNEIKVVLKSSSLIFRYNKVKRVVDLDDPYVEQVESECSDNFDDCKRKLNKPADYTYVKLRDGFNCLIHQTKVCFTCSNRYRIIGDVINIYEGKLNVELDTYLNNNKINGLVNLDIRNSVNFDDQILFIDLDEEIYKGNICDQPDSSCWGKNHIGDSLFLYKDVRIVDVVGPGFNLVQCGLKDHSYKNVLRKVDGHILDNSVVIDYSTGYINLNINMTLIPKSQVCDDKCSISDISISGCHSCPSGYQVVLKSDCRGCCKKTCFINNEKKEFTLTGYSFLYHGYTEDDSLNVDCEGFSIKRQLVATEYEAHILDSKSYVVNPGHDLINIK